MVNPSWRSDLLQSLHWVGEGRPELAAMMQLPDGSEHEHDPGNLGGQIALLTAITSKHIQRKNHNLRQCSNGQ